MLPLNSLNFFHQGPSGHQGPRGDQGEDGADVSDNLRCLFCLLP